MDVDIPVLEKKIPRYKKLFFLVSVLIFLCAGCAFFVYRILSVPPTDFPIGTNFTIAEGLTVSAITEQLAQEHIVRSALFLYITLLYHYENSYVQAGTYTFDAPLTLNEIAESITAGTHRAPLISITFPEGFRARDIASYTANALVVDSDNLFISYEGYLFPDTYYVSSDTTPRELLTLLVKTFEERLMPYETIIAQSGFTKEEVVTLASIIEREAKDLESKRMVSGILQNRLDKDMPLQVDASFNYILDKTSAELTMDDLNSDSPYNTYTHIGLPPTPIANPGIESIEAVLYPEKSEYLYYLTALDGTFHYAKTFDEHKANKARYLR